MARSGEAQNYLCQKHPDLFIIARFLGSNRHNVSHLQLWTLIFCAILIECLGRPLGRKKKTELNWNSPFNFPLSDIFCCFLLFPNISRNESMPAVIHFFFFVLDLFIYLKCSVIELLSSICWSVSQMPAIDRAEPYKSQKQHPCPTNGRWNPNICALNSCLLGPWAGSWIRITDGTWSLQSDRDIRSSGSSQCIKITAPCSSLRKLKQEENRFHSLTYFFHRHELKQDEKSSYSFSTTTFFSFYQHKSYKS